MHTCQKFNGEPLENFVISPSSRRLFLSSSSSDSKSSCLRLCCPTGTRGLSRRPLFRGATRGPQRRRFVRAGLRLRKLQNLRDDLGTLSWTPPGFCCHLRADAELFRQRCTQRRSSALLSERNPALVTHEVLERCSSFLPRALTFLAHPTLAANPNPALDHTRRLALQPDTSSERPLHDIHVHERKLHTKTLLSPTPAARCEAFAGVHRRAFCRDCCFLNVNPERSTGRAERS